jgi:hypothetical protein
MKTLFALAGAFCLFVAVVGGLARILSRDRQGAA